MTGKNVLDVQRMDWRFSDKNIMYKILFKFDIEKDHESIEKYL